MICAIEYQNRGVVIGMNDDQEEICGVVVRASIIQACEDAEKKV